MPSPRWRHELIGPYVTVFTHPDHPAVRTQPGPHIDDQGRVWPGGVNIARLVNGEWTVDPNEATYFFVKDAQDHVTFEAAM